MSGSAHRPGPGPTRPDGPRSDPDPAIAATLLLACSASVQAEVRRAALDAGCDAFEGKPIDIHTFADLLLGLIAQPRRQ